jgi:hypothetical protein
MHNSLFRNDLGSFVTASKDIYNNVFLTRITAVVNLQHQQIRILVVADCMKDDIKIDNMIQSYLKNRKLKRYHNLC